MIRLGLTGSIASGKSTVARQITSYNFAIIDADAIAHDLMSKDYDTVDAVVDIFGSNIKDDDMISREKLGAIVFSDEVKLVQLEAILHPRIVAREEALYERAKRQGYRGAVFDIPLLFESDAPERFDCIATTYAPDWLIRQRALARSNITEAKLANILAKQMPQREKIRHSDVIIPTGIGQRESLRHVHALVHSLL